MFKLNRKQRRMLSGRTKRVSSTKLGAGSENNPVVWRKNKYAKPKATIVEITGSRKEKKNTIFSYRALIKALGKFINIESPVQYNVGQYIKV